MRTRTSSPRSRRSITVSILALGWLGEEAVATLVDAALSRFGIVAPEAAVHTTSGAIIAFLLVTFFLIVFGQLMPRTKHCATSTGGCTA